MYAIYVCVRARAYVLCTRIPSRNYISFLRMCVHFESTVWCQNYSHAPKRKSNAVVDTVVTIIDAASMKKFVGF